ncbi:MAG: DUF3108 domain-containing protein [Gallionella sp.]|nr:DUF3108 domain-containing protein [Gallionella sp.]
MKIFWHLIAWLTLVVAGSAHAAPDSVLATYDIYKSGIKIGVIEESYRRDKDHYTLASITTPVGLLAMFKPEKVFIDSSGTLGKQGLQPALFSHRRERDSVKDSKAEFDRAAGQLALIHHGQREIVSFPEGTQDRLSAMYQFMFLSPRAGGTLEFPMTNGVKLDTYHYAVARGPKVKTPAGEFDTFYLDNQAKAGESRTEIWLSKQRHNLPCKMVITEADGGQLTQILSKLQIR